MCFKYHKYCSLGFCCWETSMDTAQILQWDKGPCTTSTSAPHPCPHNMQKISMYRPSLTDNGIKIWSFSRLCERISIFIYRKYIQEDNLQSTLRCRLYLKWAKWLDFMMSTVGQFASEDKHSLKVGNRRHYCCLARSFLEHYTVLSRSGQVCLSWERRLYQGCLSWEVAKTASSNSCHQMVVVVEGRWTCFLLLASGCSHNYSLPVAGEAFQQQRNAMVYSCLPYRLPSLSSLQSHHYCSCLPTFWHHQIHSVGAQTHCFPSDLWERNRCHPVPHCSRFFSDYFAFPFQ